MESNVTCQCWQASWYQQGIANIKTKFHKAIGNLPLENESNIDNEKKDDDFNNPLWAPNDVMITDLGDEYKSNKVDSNEGNSPLRKAFQVYAVNQDNKKGLN